MKAIVFDVDDTLYDLSTPFKQTCREIFPEDTDLDLEGAFLASRRYSDSVYARCLSGEMSMEEMYTKRSVKFLGQLTLTDILHMGWATVSALRSMNLPTSLQNVLTNSEQGTLLQ